MKLIGWRQLRVGKKISLGPETQQLSSNVNTVAMPLPHKLKIA